MSVLGVFVGFFLNHRRTLIVTLNIALTVASFIAALALRFDFNIAEKLNVAFVCLPLLVLIAARAAAYTFYDLNQGYWRFVSTHEALTIVKAHVLSTLVFMAAVGLFQIPGFPRSLAFIELALSLLLCAGSRVAVRLWCEYYLSKKAQRLLGPRREVIIVGGAVNGHLIIKTMRSQQKLHYNPIAVFDDDSSLWGQSVHGVKVVGAISRIPEFLKKNPNITSIIVSASHLSEEKQKQLDVWADRAGVTSQRLRGVDDILSSSLAGGDTIMTPEELLNREVKIEHENEIQQVIGGRRVLITGAGGSIGSELVRQVLMYEPSTLVLVDKSEFNLYQIEQEARDLAYAKNTKKYFSLGDIVNRTQMKRLFNTHKPEIVFHAAAYKHVPLLEDNTHDGFVNNVIGTRTLLEVCESHDVERFVLISTDKAVDPSSVMGCTKRIAELMVKRVGDGISMNGGAEESGMSTAVVRFGNVINSAGSVIPLFIKQIQSGGPITVTHEKMERYFMSIREAVRLVLTAGTLGDRGEIYLLDMGKPIRIMDVAQKMRALYGREDIPITVTGLRPGEKLTERLYAVTEKRSNTKFNKVFSVRPHQDSDLNILDLVSALEEQVDDLSNDQLGQLLKNLIANQHNPERAYEFVADADKRSNIMTRIATRRIAVG